MGLVKSTSLDFEVVNPLKQDHDQAISKPDTDQKGYLPPHSALTDPHQDRELLDDSDLSGSLYDVAEAH